MIKTIAIVLTACGIETSIYQRMENELIALQQHLPPAVLKQVKARQFRLTCDAQLQQHLPLAVCATECEAAEERSDDEARTSQVPERREGKTKAISNNTYLLRYAPKGARQQRSKAKVKRR